MLLSLILAQPSPAQNATSANILTAEERAWLAAHPTLILSPDPAYQPVDFFDEQGVYRGISADYIALIEQRLGFRFQVINRNNDLAAFNAGQMRIDAMPSCAATPNRMKDWVFTTPYLEFPTYIITRNSVTETLTLDQLSGYRVAVVGNYAAREYLVTNHPNLVLDQVADARTGLQKVSFGLVDAFVSELPVATYWMEREGITNLKMSGEAGYVYRLGFGMSKEVAPLHGILEKGLAQITPGERAAIYQKWVHLPNESSPFNRRLALGLLGGLSVAGLGLLFVLWWNRSLAAQVKQRTAALQQELTEHELAEKELHASEARFAKAFRSSPNPVCLARFSDGQILAVNDRWLELSGCTQEDLVGRLDSEMGLWDDFQLRERILQMLRSRQPVRDLEVTYRTKAGEQRHGLLSVEPIRWDKRRCHLWTILDITDRKRAEEALQQSEALFRSLTETTSAWVFIVQGTTLRYFNAAAEAGTGFTREELAGKEIWAVIHPDDHHLIRERIQARRQGLPLSLSYEARALTKAGEPRWMQVTTTTIAYQDGSAELSTAFDITERKLAEEALQQSEALFRSLTESTSAWVFIVQAERLTYINAAAEAGMGYSRTELLGKYLWPLVPPEDHPVIQERIQQRIQGLPLAPHYEVRIINKAGEIRWLQISSRIITYQNALADLSTAFDITERKRAEEALQQSEQMFRSLTETTSAWVFIEQNDCCVYVNSAAEAGTEYTRGELATMKIWKLAHPDDQQRIYERVLSRKKGIPLPPNYEVRVLTKSGQLRWLQMTTTPIEYKGASAVLGTAFDITDRKRAEEGLQKSEELFRSLTESTTAWVYVFQNRHLSYVNPAAEKGMGYTRDELFALTFEQLVHPDELKWHKERIAAHFAGQEVSTSVEARTITKSGEVRWLAVATKRIEYQGAPATLNTAFDITDRKLAEEQLKISEQRLHQLAGYLQTVREQERTSIAREIHDELGQAMTALKMDLAWLIKNVPSEQTSLHERLRGMTDLANDTIKTVRRLATQLRPGVLDDLGLLAALEWQAQEFQTRTGIVCEFIADVEINDLAPEHATALFRICQESLTNVARHAQATQVNIHLWGEGNHLLLEIKDNGRGITINETTNSRSFGLLGMQERAFLLGGEFQLAGRPNQGTTVTARIPLSQSMARGGGL